MCALDGLGLVWTVCVDPSLWAAHAVSRCGLTDMNVCLYARYVVDMRGLRELWFAHNACGDHGARAAAAALRSQPCMRGVNASHNDIGGAGAAAIAGTLTAPSRALAVFSALQLLTSRVSAAYVGESTTLRECDLSRACTHAGVRSLGSVRRSVTLPLLRTQTIRFAVREPGLLRHHFAQARH